MSDSYNGCNCEECLSESGIDVAARYREDLVTALQFLPQVERDAIGTAIENQWPICVGTWDAQGVKQSYTCLMGAAALAATEHVWGEIPALCEDLGTLERLASENLSPQAMDVPGPFDEYFFMDANKERFTRFATGSQSTRILNAAGRREMAAILAEANESPYPSIY